MHQVPRSSSRAVLLVGTSLRRGYRERPPMGGVAMFIEVPDEATVDADVADWYDRQRASWGYLPNYAPAFATRPDVAEAWNTLNNAVRRHMERRRFELTTIAAARAYQSTYCTAAHSKFL